MTFFFLPVEAKSKVVAYGRYHRVFSSHLDFTAVLSHVLCQGIRPVLGNAVWDFRDGLLDRVHTMQRLDWTHGMALSEDPAVSSDVGALLKNQLASTLVNLDTCNQYSLST